ncbi:unnamed protein product [Microthlaspi erraticum]|uniref:FHA domain-containing protein n=1 Tax=Microthlaspi erraticum TaxID=1685480 RepID=A0A6D2HZV2_9BRAS|nr:unnamed protein product [Microthlaspi erraticum]
MEVKEEKPMEEKLQVREKTIPVFTVLKNGSILKNIFVVNSRDFSSPVKNGDAISDDDEVEEILLVGRHPDCDILLTHPSISRYHLQIRSVPSRQKLFVTDLSSVHGTWVTDQKVDPDACVEVKEGDVIRIGGSTRIYRLHWIPLSRAYDIDNPFVSPLDASIVMEQDEENRILEAENLDQSQANTASGDDGDLHLDVTSEGSGSSVPSEDEDTRELSLPLASPLSRDSVKTQKLQFEEHVQTLTKWDVDVVEAAAEKPSSSCPSSKQQSGGYLEGLGCFDDEDSAEGDEWNARGDGFLHDLDVMSDMMESPVPNEDENPFLGAKKTSSFPLPRDSFEIEKLQLTEDIQASPELAVDVIQVKAENLRSGLSSCSPSKGQIDGCFEASGCTAFELASEAEILSLHQDVSKETEFFKELMVASAEPLTQPEIWNHVDTGDTEVSGQAERLLQILTEDALCLLGSEIQSEVSIEINSENLHQKSNEVSPAGDREPEKVLDEGSSSCLYEYLQQSGTQSFLSLANLKSETEMSIVSERSGDSYNLSEIGDEEITDKEVPVRSTLAAETFEDIIRIEELPSCYTESQENQTQQPHAVREDALSEMDISRKGMAASVTLLELSGCSAFELAAEVEILSLHQEISGETEFVTEQGTEASAEPLTKAEIQSHEDGGESEVSRQVVAVSPISFPQTEPTLTGDDRCLLGSEVATETDSENLHQTRNEETKIVSRQAGAVSDCLFASNEYLSRIDTEDLESLWSSWQPQAEAPSEIPSEVSPAGDHNQISATKRETENIFDEGSSSSCLSENLKQSFLLTPKHQKPRTELSIGSGRSEESYSQPEIEGEGNTDTASPILSTLAEDTLAEELLTDYAGSRENQTPQTHAVRDDVLSELDSSITSSRTLSTCNIWSRRGKAASVLQVRTNSSKGKQKHIGNQPKAQLQRKLALSDNKSTSLNVHYGAENLEPPEIFTPDKENLTPSSHMLKRLQDIGDIKDSKSSSKLSGKSSCSLKTPYSIAAIVTTSGALTEPEIFTPDKENLTPNSHMLKRLREVGDIKDTKGSSSKATRKPFFDVHAEENVMAERKPNLQILSSKSKVKRHDEPVALKKKVERPPFQPLLEKSSSQSQSYTEASSIASVRSNVSRGIRSSSNLSGGSKMKWTIVLDTSSLLDKESRKPLHLLQGLKGTHLVVPRTVLRELNETKRTRSLLYRRTAETASSALEWIEECKVNTKWWIQLQCSSEETKANAPTPPVTPLSYSSPFPFSLHWNNNNNAPEIDSPTSEDQVLECALLYRNRNIDEKLVLLSNDVTLKVKAMAEGVICETANEFYESLKNPFSERFMWPESLPRGRTWSHLDDVVLKERYNNRTTYNGGGSGAVAAKGLKLILLHNSHYGHIQQ